MCEKSVVGALCVRRWQFLYHCSGWQMVQGLQIHAHTSLLTLLGGAQWWGRPLAYSFTQVNRTQQMVFMAAYHGKAVTKMASTRPFSRNLMNFDLVLDQMLFLCRQLESRLAIKVTFRLYTLCAGMCTMPKSYSVMTNNQSNH